jgi:hypothetical protein
MMNKVQQQTGAAIREAIIDMLDRATGDDETIDYIADVCARMNRVDASIDTDTLLNDRKVQAAFKKFVTLTIGAFQQFEGESGG